VSGSLEEDSLLRQVKNWKSIWNQKMRRNIDQNLRHEVVTYPGLRGQDQGAGDQDQALEGQDQGVGGRGR
jgi:hypothetical protein